MLVTHIESIKQYDYDLVELLNEKVYCIGPKTYDRLVAMGFTKVEMHGLVAEDIKIKGKKITFTLLDKTITTKIIKTYVAQTGGGKDERPVILLNLLFAGTEYRDVLFSLNTRTEMSTEVLLNRDVMNRLNVMVNPQRKYVVTTKYSLE